MLKTASQRYTIILVTLNKAFSVDIQSCQHNNHTEHTPGAASSNPCSHEHKRSTHKRLHGSDPQHRVKTTGRIRRQVTPSNGSTHKEDLQENVIMLKIKSLLLCLTVIMAASWRHITSYVFTGNLRISEKLMVKNYSLVWEFVVSTVAHPGVCLIHNSSDVRWRHGIRRRPHAGDIKRCASCLN